MIIRIDTNKCFECGDIATEQHHIIPQVYGGTKTVPLCSSCHMKVHGIKSGRRIDNHIENTKRGLDKKRVWELLSGWLIQKIYISNTKKEFKIYHKSLFGKILSDYKINSIYQRLNQLEEDFLLSLFKNEINNTIVNTFIKEGKFDLIDSKIIYIVSKYIKESRGNLGKPKNLTDDARKAGREKRTLKASIDKSNILNTKKIVELKNKGYSFNKIAIKMNELGFKSRRGKSINKVQCIRLYNKHKENTTGNNV